MTDLVGIIHLFWQTELSLGQPGSLSNLKRFFFCQCLVLHIWHTISRTIWSDGFCANMNKYCIYDKLRQIIFLKSLTFSRKYMYVWKIFEKEIHGPNHFICSSKCDAEIFAGKNPTDGDNIFKMMIKDKRICRWTENSSFYENWSEQAFPRKKN